MDLYINFKLKVEKAREMGLDTVTSLQEELAGYRNKLADSYLSDKEVSDRLIKEVYDRMQEDVEISHILISVGKKVSREDKQAAEKKIIEVYNRLKKGDDFTMLASEYSTDNNSNKNGGYLGYYTAMMPDGFYELENAMYTVKSGDYSRPFLSKIGYQIIKVNSRRPAYGEIDVAHVLVRKDKSDMKDQNALKRLKTVKDLLASGTSFEEVATRHSEDKQTAKKQGRLGYFGINKFDKAFENAAFALNADGEISDVVETTIGYHIIKRLKKKDLSDFKSIKGHIRPKISKSERSDIARKAMIENIKKEGKFHEDRKILADFISKLDDQFYSYKWQVPEMKSKSLFSFDNAGLKYSVNDFAQYCKKSSRTRLRFDKKAPIDENVTSLYNSFVDEKAISYEEGNLETKYPEFKALMREYSEGILLFEATKMQVWDKASSDTIGLKSFFKKNSSNYKWDQRAVTTKYTINSLDKNVLNKIRKDSRKNNPEDVVKHHSDDVTVSTEEQIHEKGSRLIEVIPFKKGGLSPYNKDRKLGTSSFMIIKDILPPVAKTMKEARGYIIADYQDHLEKEWISELRKKYKVRINEKVFESLVKE